GNALEPREDLRRRGAVGNGCLAHAARIASFAAFCLFRRLAVRAPAQDRLARGRGLVEAAARRQMRRAVEIGGIAGMRALGEAAQHSDEAVEPGLAFV